MTVFMQKQVIGFHSNWHKGCLTANNGEKDLTLGIWADIGNHLQA